MAKVHVMDHPLIAHKISYIRSEEVGTKEFREMIGEIAQLMCYEATRDLKLEDVQIKTPICEMTGKSCIEANHFLSKDMDIAMKNAVSTESPLGKRY